MHKIIEIFEVSGFRVISYNEDFFYKTWSEVESQENDLPLEYSYNTLEYQWEYFMNSNDSENNSLVVVFNGTPIALWPIITFNGKDLLKHKTLTTHGGSLLLPYLISMINNNIRNQFLNVLERVLDLLIHNFNFSIKIEHSNYQYAHLISWCYKNKLNSEIVYFQRIDLTNSENEIFSAIRKSYKALINKSIREFNILVHLNVSNELWDKFKAFHFKQSGKLTRSVETWEIQKKQLNNGSSCLITIEDKFDYLGFALFNFNKAQAVYAVGAYDRDKFDLPIGHGIQWTAIKFFKSMGIKDYLIGELVSPHQGDEKVDNIAKFKTGFGETNYYVKFFK